MGLRDRAGHPGAPSAGLPGVLGWLRFCYVNGAAVIGLVAHTRRSPASKTQSQGRSCKLPSHYVFLLLLPYPQNPDFAQSDTVQPQDRIHMQNNHSRPLFPFSLVDKNIHFIRD